MWRAVLGSRAHHKLDARAFAEKQLLSLPRPCLANTVHLQRRQLPKLAAHLLRQGQWSGVKKQSLHLLLPQCPFPLPKTCCTLPCTRMRILRLQLRKSIQRQPCSHWDYPRLGWCYCCRCHRGQGVDRAGVSEAFKFKTDYEVEI